MQLLRTVTTVTLGASFLLGTLAAGAAPTLSSGEVTSALQTIKRDADQIAAGKYKGKSLQAPAHQIGEQWYRVEPTLAKNGAVLVETRMANRAITAFDKTWTHNGKARSAAQQVSATVADLLSAHQDYPRKASGSGAATSGRASAAPATPSGSAAPSAAPSAKASPAPSAKASPAPSSRP